MLEHPQQHAGGAEFQRLRHVHTVGVAHDHVQSTVCIGTVRFVTGVDDGPVEGGLQSHFHVEVVGALAELVAGALAALPQADATGACIDLPRNEMRGHQPCHMLERHRTQHHIVFMRAPTGAFAVHVVAMQHDGAARDAARLLRGLLHDQITGMVVEHRLEGVRGFRRGVFRMRVVDIYASAIGCDHVGDVELWRVGEQVGMCAGAFQTGAAGVVDGIFLPIVPADMLRAFIRGGADHIE